MEQASIELATNVKGKHYTVLALTEAEQGLLESFKQHVEEVGEYGIGLPDKQARVKQHPLTYELVAYVADKIGLRPVRFHFWSASPAKKTDRIEIGCESRELEINLKKFIEPDAGKFKIIPKVYFAYAEEPGIMKVEALIDEEMVNAVGDGTFQSTVLDVMNDATMLLSRKGKNRPQNEGQAMVSNNYFHLGVAPATYLPQALEMISEVFITVSAEDLRDLVDIKRELSKRERRPQEEAAVAEALRIGYRKHLENSLESRLAFFEFIQ